MRSLIIAGAGGHGHVVAEAALSTGIWRSISFADDRFPSIDPAIRFPLITGMQDLPHILDSTVDLVIAIGDNRSRVALIRQYREFQERMPSILHPTASVSPSAELGANAVILAQAAINARTVLKAGVIVNTGASVDHDCILEEGVHVSPGVHLAGNVSVGRCTWLGIGSCVIQGIRIGENVTVGAGAVVIRDIPDGVTAVGVPARVVKCAGRR